MPSWRVLRVSDKWLTASDLFSMKEERYFEVDCEIVSVSQGEANQPGSDKVKKLPALTLRSLRTGKELPKPLGLNATNGLTVEQLAGTDDYKRWPGVKLTLFVLPDVRFGRERRPAIRIRPEPPPLPSSGPKSAPPPASPPPVTEPPRGYHGEPPPMTDDEKRELLERERRENQR